MENWHKYFLLSSGLAALLGPATVCAQQSGSVQVIQPNIERQVIKPSQIDTENLEVGLYYGVISIEDFDSNDVIGIRAAYHVTEDLFFEINYGQSEGDLTSFEELSGSSPLLTDEDRDYSYYDLNIGWNILPGEVFIGSKYAFNSSLYLIAGIGSTEFAGDDWFTVSYGAGFRLLLTDWLAWHIDVRDHVFDRDTLGQEETTHNVEFNTGFTVFF